MVRKLKTFQTSLPSSGRGAFDEERRSKGAGSNLFHQGVAKETDDPKVVAAMTSKPGVVFKRAAGSNGRFAEQSDLLSDLASGEDRARRESIARSRRSEPLRRLLQNSAKAKPARPPPNSRRSRSGANSSAGARRPFGKGARTAREGATPMLRPRYCGDRPIYVDLIGTAFNVVTQKWSVIWSESIVPDG
jgi:hypothetical protein